MNNKLCIQLLFVFSFFLYCTVAKADSDKTIKIGMILPYSGAVAIIGEEITNALELAFEEVNYEVSGRKLKIIRADTEYKPNIALKKARELIASEKVDILAGTVSSSVALAIRDLVVSTKTPFIVANAGANQITGKKCSKYIIRVSFSNYQINAPMGPWLANYGIKTAFLLSANYAAGKEQMKAFKSTFEASGGKIIGEEYTPHRKTKDFGPYLGRIKSSGADAVYVFYAGGEAINFIKQAHSFGLPDIMKITGAGWTTSPLFIPAQKEAALGFTGILNYVPSIETKENIEFQRAYKDKFGRIASEFAVQGYDTGRMIVEALQSLSGETTNKELLAEELSKVSIIGPRGPLTIDPKTNNVIQNMYIFEVVNSANGPILKILDKIEAVKDPGTGCSL